MTFKKILLPKCSELVKEPVVPFGVTEFTAKEELKIARLLHFRAIFDWPLNIMK